MAGQCKPMGYLRTLLLNSFQCMTSSHGSMRLGTCLAMAHMNSFQKTVHELIFSGRVRTSPRMRVCSKCMVQATSWTFSSRIAQWSTNSCQRSNCSLKVISTFAITTSRPITVLEPEVIANHTTPPQPKFSEKLPQQILKQADFKDLAN